jgi:NAD(P)-dependent dehydrogenase (short-subunit alcohol dehydrogenase family)
MAERPRVLIAGGSGVFGRLLARELLKTTSVDLILAGRGLSAVVAACRELDQPDRTFAMALDLGDPESLTRAARGCVAVACAAGPFQELPSELPTAVVRAGGHWVDISDDEGWVVPLLDDTTLDAAARDAGLAVIPGLSTVPALSGALARWCRERLQGAERARVTLFIGNQNARGAGAIASAMASGFGRPTRVDLPFGRRLAYLGHSPDTELLRRDLGLDAEFRVVLEWARWACSSPASGCSGPTSAIERGPGSPISSHRSPRHSPDLDRRADAYRSSCGKASGGGAWPP